MEDRLPQLEARLAHLTDAVEALGKRVAALEGLPAPSAPPAADEAAAQAPETPAVTAAGEGRPDLVAVFSLVGRSFIVLGGAFLLRALTESGTLPPLGGVLAGLAYAAVCTAAADRAAAGRRRWSAVFHAGTAVLVGFPLVWEATTRFQVFSAATSALVLGAAVALPFAVSWRRRLQTPAWIATIGALAVSLGLIAATREVVPYAVFLIALGTATLWKGYSLDWVGLRWPVALAANLVVSGLTVRALRPDPPDSVAVTVAVQVLLVAAYLVSIGVRTLVRQRNVVPFEVVQTALVLVVGFGGAVSVARAAGGGVALVAEVFLLFGVTSYAIAVRFLDRRTDRRRNVYFYTSIALVFVLAGTALLAPPALLSATWALLAVAGCVLWARASRFFLLIHGAVYFVAAGIGAGVFGYSAGVMVGTPASPWVWPSPVLGLLVLAGAACAWWAASDRNADVRRAAHGPRLVIIVGLVWLAGGETVGLLAPWMAADGSGGIDPGTLATLRTGVLSMAALLIAGIGRQPRFVEWNWLVYPLLAVTGVKVLAQDFSASRPATLFVALALYGAALILAPRLRGVRAPAAA